MILINPRVIQNWSPLIGPCSESKLSQLSSDLSLMQTSRSVKKTLNTSLNAGIRFIIKRINVCVYLKFDVSKRIALAKLGNSLLDLLPAR